MGGLCGLQSRGALRCRQPEKLWRFMKGPPFPFSLCSELHSWSRMRNHPHAEVIDVSLIVSLKLREPDLMLRLNPNMRQLSFFENPFIYHRRKTREVKVGNVGIGGDQPH